MICNQGACLNFFTSASVQSFEEWHAQKKYLWKRRGIQITKVVVKKKRQYTKRKKEEVMKVIDDDALLDMYLMSDELTRDAKDNDRHILAKKREQPLTVSQSMNDFNDSLSDCLNFTILECAGIQRVACTKEECMEYAAQDSIYCICTSRNGGSI